MNQKNRTEETGKHAKTKLRASLFLLILLLSSFAFLKASLAIPSGPQISYNVTENITYAPATFINTSGGSFTTLNFNATTQNTRWKAYVGNVTGKLVLDDANNRTIYDWEPTAIAGEVYATRNNSIDWSRINCSNSSVILAEEAFLGHNSSNIDSISRTFNETAHGSFYVGNRFIQANSCNSTYTYVNSTRQSRSLNSSFQEILLDDDGSLVYTTLLENSVYGFDFGQYDFQMIVAERETGQPTPYYFYIELT